MHISSIININNTIININGLKSDVVAHTCCDEVDSRLEEDTEDQKLNFVLSYTAISRSAWEYIYIPVWENKEINVANITKEIVQKSKYGMVSIATVVNSRCKRG